MSKLVIARFGATAAVVTGIACSASTALGRPIFTPFNSEAAFVAANGGSTLLDNLNDAPLGDFTTLVRPLFQIDATRANDADILSGSSFGQIDGTPFFEGFVSTPTDVSDTVALNLNSSMTGFGAYFKDAGSGAGVAIFADGNFVTSLTSTGFSTVFFGFNSDTPFSGITFVRSGDNGTFGEIFSVDNIRLAVIPEPTSALALLGVGLVAMRRWGR